MPSAISMDRPPYPSGHTVLNRRAWTAEEDMLLTQCVKINGEARWTSIPRKTGLKRSGKSCRLRWLNYLRPDIKHGHISSDEEELIIRMHRLLGNRWALIAGRLPGRTDNEIKNYWNAHLAKKSLSNNKFLPKSETKVKHASSAVDGLLRVTPVKAKALRIAKDWNKDVGSGSSNHQTTDNAQTVNASNTDGFDLSLEELMTDHHSGIIDFRMPTEQESLSVEINGQYSLEDFRIDEFQASPSYYMQMSSLYYNMEKLENFTDSDYQEMEGIYGSKQHSDWVDELLNLQM